MAAISKNVCFDSIVNKYNNTVHRHQLMLHLIFMLNKMKILMKKISNLKLLIV